MKGFTARALGLILALATVLALPLAQVAGASGRICSPAYIYSGDGLTATVQCDLNELFDD